MFEGPAWLVAQFYSFTHNYAIAIGLVAVCIMLLVTPLTLKSTKGMLEMQRLQPEMRRLQAQYRGDRMKLNEEMMKLYQEHKVNPLASCLPLLLQMPIFFIMFRVLHGLTNTTAEAVVLADGTEVAAGTFLPSYISHSSELFKSLVGKTEMLSFGLDLSKSPAHFISEGLGEGLIYAALVVLLGSLYYIQQRMVASRAAMSPTMSPTQQKVMQYLPVVFAVFQIFFLTGLVIYYITQALFRIGQNAYITKRFYGHDESLGRQAQAAGARAREEAKANGTDTGGGLFAQAKRDAIAKREAVETKGKPASNSRTTPAKPKPTSSGRSTGKPAATTGKPVNKPVNAKDAPKPGSSKPEATKANGSQTNGETESAVAKGVTPPKNRPTPSANRPQRPAPSGKPGAPRPPKK